jgi:hypothetical protein
MFTGTPVTPADYLSPDKVYSVWIAYPGPQSVRNSRIKTFVCPSDDPYSARIAYGASSVYRQPGGFVFEVAFTGNTAFDAELGRTNYAGVAGYAGLGVGADQFSGLFCNRTRVTLETVTAADGTSNTLMFGEYLADFDTGPRTYSASWMGMGPVVTAWGTWTGPAPASPQPGQPQFGHEFFSSKHTGIVQFCNGDGSVRGVRKGLLPSSNAWTSYVFMSGWRDGQVVDASQVGS